MDAPAHSQRPRRPSRPHLGHRGKHRPPRPPHPCLGADAHGRHCLTAVRRCRNG